MSTLVDTVEFTRYLTDVSTKVDTYQQLPESVGGGAMWVGRTVGAMDGAIEPPRMGLRRVLPTHMAPPNQQKASSGF
ncbi:hypothetical protein B9Y85_02455 [Stenotrophomonas maltophilia]|uniref:Uncharacterized protein n=1 Tax=Stenotrophomonas maltophilia TaxID=40324 RepID=A0A2J0T0H2_STEMA|nr:hypothetical protein [Stenotrophomonas maltophilia]PJL03872.1 hypothetical protein B9Y57_08190 [Stenotrophomonas maltophilia]PJL30469.1 hypothetical protein B9Y65_08190 [Stenotrophomonas maltophilia]PJL69393.1 hypothetical protein B9Y85_02455 [Stenotrophomonas maltophilia]